MTQIQIGINIEGSLEGSFTEVNNMGSALREAIQGVLAGKVVSPTITIQRIDNAVAVDM